jgi:hypothetical protein
MRQPSGVRGSQVPRRCRDGRGCCWRSICSRFCKTETVERFWWAEYSIEFNGDPTYVAIEISNLYFEEEMAENPAGSPMDRRLDQEFELARLRIELSARYVGQMIHIIALIAGIISLIVVISVVVIALTNNSEIPEVLKNWGGIILGFYFGQFISLVKDYMGVVQSSTLIAPSDQGRSPPPPIQSPPR